MEKDNIFARMAPEKLPTFPDGISEPVNLRTASEIEQWKERLALKAAIPIGIAAAKRHARNAVIEEVAVMLGREYPGNDNTNAFCAAVRSMKVHAD
ncbi:hypothetical protein UFOVP1349_28 [uncultured Caudovirales phage]|uniref:Uncharacterized protein n=1 Tax=uncultured Caudovirales phage TaxID=2100421 RepID=A0A6J5QKF4_9CAUD|nr:hypothetical protein UFOVP925_15 [uncultured Caudovirales phage]CAB4184192.1 hypothetical protein UFOVP1097_34 [uncultured Caudovirales phage]CAB4200103.1 hypothetical protein UFOVP1349_28 [uncultured Caudovirales phage]CAB4213990.1 hypothetical protein UFOVP1456_8 [uncultured Caudovirales phage]